MFSMLAIFYLEFLVVRSFNSKRSFRLTQVRINSTFRRGRKAVCFTRDPAHRDSFGYRRLNNGAHIRWTVLYPHGLR